MPTNAYKTSSSINEPVFYSHVQDLFFLQTLDSDQTVNFPYPPSLNSKRDYSEGHVKTLIVH